VQSGRGLGVAFADAALEVAVVPAGTPHSASSGKQRRDACPVSRWALDHERPTERCDTVGGPNQTGTQREIGFADVVVSRIGPSLHLRRSKPYSNSRFGVTLAHRVVAHDMFRTCPRLRV
jgi:hypothetical protein